MKELSIEEKAKAYDKALKVIKDNLDALNEIAETGAKIVNIQSIKNCFHRAFPELIESEDEKIRKRIIAFVNAYGQGMYKDEMLAWLEKKGKQKETLCDKCKKTQPSHSCQDITALGRCALEKQGEQKLTKFEKAVKQVMEEAIECGDTHNLKADADMLLSLVHNSSWSEEDEKLLDKVIKRLHKYSAEDEEYLDKYYWLIELKHRVQPQNTWKPSDEQMITLRHVISGCSYDIEPLVEIEEQLKKLIGE